MSRSKAENPALQLDALIELRRVKAYELAEWAGISPVNLSRIRNNTVWPSQDTAVALARALDVPLYMLFTGAPIPPTLGPLPPKIDRSLTEAA